MLIGNEHDSLAQIVSLCLLKTRQEASWSQRITLAVLCSRDVGKALEHIFYLSHPSKCFTMRDFTRMLAIIAVCFIILSTASIIHRPGEVPEHP